MIVFGYWNIRGLAEPSRLMLEYLGVPYEDKRYNFGTTPETFGQEWKQVKYQLNLDFPNLPYLIDGEVRLTQSCAIQRYLARKFNMVGETEEDRIRADLTEQQCVDFRNGLARLAYGPNFEQNLPAYKEALPAKLREFDVFLGGKHEWFGGSKISYADFMMYATLHSHRILAPEILGLFENLKIFMQRFEALPRVSEYLQSDRFKNAALNMAAATWGNVPLN